MTLFLTVLHVMVCIFLIVVVLLQRGKGAEIGAVFGGGSGAMLFGSRGAGNFLTRLTTAAAVVFMLTSLSLAYFAREGSRSTLFDEEEPAKPAAPDSPFQPAPAAKGEAPAAGGFQEVPAPATQEPPKAPAPAEQRAPSTP